MIVQSLNVTRARQNRRQATFNSKDDNYYRYGNQVYLKDTHKPMDKKPQKALFLLIFGLWCLAAGLFAKRSIYK